jgi:serine/threonine protein phosphatase PrpC
MTDTIIAGFHTKSYYDKENIKRKCQDYHAIQIKQEEQFCVFAVADGAGSAEHADIGARVVCKRICRIMHKDFDYFFDCDPLLVKKIIIQKLRRSLRFAAKEKQSLLDEFASTLLFVAIKQNKIIVGHIGDGMIVYCKNNRLEILSHPENGEFLNLTYFVTSKYYLHHLRLYKGDVENIRSIFLMTDGMANIFYSRKQKKILKSFFESINNLDANNEVALERSIRTLLETNISKRTNDDCTLVAAYIP